LRWSRTASRFWGRRGRPWLHILGRAGFATVFPRLVLFFFGIRYAQPCRAGAHGARNWWSNTASSNASSASPPQLKGGVFIPRTSSRHTEALAAHFRKTRCGSSEWIWSTERRSLRPCDRKPRNDYRKIPFGIPACGRTRERSRYPLATNTVGGELPRQLAATGP